MGTTPLLSVLILLYMVLCWGVVYFILYVSRTDSNEAFIGVLGIQDICHFTSRDIGYYPFYFQGYGILGSIFLLLPGILKILEN